MDRAQNMIGPRKLIVIIGVMGPKQKAEKKKKTNGSTGSAKGAW